MKIKDAVQWLMTFADQDGELTVDIYYPGDEWPHNRKVKSFRNEMKRVMVEGDSSTGHTELRTVILYDGKTKTEKEV